MFQCNKITLEVSSRDFFTKIGRSSVFTFFNVEAIREQQMKTNQNALQPIY